MDNYSGYFLCSGNGANADYFSASVNVHPGAGLRYTNGSEKNILLAGGFSSIHPDSSFPLSPTLQLNGDLTDTDDTKMIALARAEFTRHTGQSQNRIGRKKQQLGQKSSDKGSDSFRSTLLCATRKRRFLKKTE